MLQGLTGFLIFTSSRKLLSIENPAENFPPGEFGIKIAIEIVSKNR